MPQENEDETLLSERADLYFKRSDDVLNQHLELLKLCLQLSFFANGGSTLAVLSLSTALFSSTTNSSLQVVVSGDALIAAFAISTLVFALGLMSTLLAALALSYSRRLWGHFWESVAGTGEIDFTSNEAKKATILSKIGYILTFTSFLAFIAGVLNCCRALISAHT